MFCMFITQLCIIFILQGTAFTTDATVFVEPWIFIQVLSITLIQPERFSRATLFSRRRFITDRIRMRPTLSPRQRQLLSFIEQYIQEHGFPPSYEEMRSALQVSSLNGIAEMIAALERKGYIRRQPGRSRAINLQASPPETPDLPLQSRKCETLPILGAGTADNPLAALLRPRGLVSVDSDFFALTGQAWVAALVPDDTMAQEGIRQGDVAIIEQSSNPTDGALVYGFAGERPFVRRYVATGATYELRASRRCIAPLRCDGQTLIAIIGIVRGILRRL